MSLAFAVAYAGTVLLAAGLLASSQLVPSLPVALWDAAAAGLAAGAIVFVTARP